MKPRRTGFHVKRSRTDARVNRALLTASVLAAAILLLSPQLAPAAPQKIPSGSDVVSAAAYASSDPAARGSSVQLALVMKIRPGFHVNAHQASADYLIPTTLRPELPSGFKSGEVAYPKGELHTFSFSKTPLNVYQGTVVLRLPLSIPPNAPTGAQNLPLKLRYQACSSEICLPPVTISLAAPVTIAASPSQARPAHSELFPSR